jgi:RND family efflux transporter MFP subunit
LNVTRGAQVEKGQLLGELDGSDYRVALAQAQASYESARTQRDVAQSTFNRTERLFEGGASSLADYENAKGQIRSAQAQLSAASQQVKQAKNQLEYTRMVAPFDGIVNDVPAKSGEQVGPGQTIAVVSKGGELEVEVGVPEGMISSIKQGTAASIKVSALGDGELEGVVREVGYGSASSTYPVRITITKKVDDLRPGMAAEANFVIEKKAAALAVPVSAVANAESSSYVYKLVESGKGYKVQRTDVELGPLLRSKFEVISGLATGDKVATAGLSNLVDGMQVRLLDETTP